MPTKFPQAGAIPGQFFGQAPNWWNNSDPNNVVVDELDDPRWIGSYNHSYAYGTGDHAAVRFLHHFEGDIEAGTTYLYLSFRAYTDPHPDAQFDRIYLGLHRPARGAVGAGPAYIVEIDSPASTAVGGAAPAVAWNTIPPGGGEMTAIGGAPVLHERHWLADPGAGSNNHPWGINIRIPTTSGGAADLGALGINLGDLSQGGAFKLWYAIVVDTNQADPNDPNATIAWHFTYPRWATLGRAPDFAPFDANLVPGFPSVDTWDDASLGAGAGTGISLAMSDITCNGGTNQIGASLNHTVTNKFVIKAKNNGITPTIPAGAIQAGVRIANWGSQTPIDKAPAGFETWQAIPFHGTPPAAPTSNPATPTNLAEGADQKIEFDFDWVIDQTTARYWVSPPPPPTPPAPMLDLHQCVLVQLTQVTGSGAPPGPPGGYDFLNDSMYNNMNVKPTASPARQTAEISVRGRPPGAGGPGAPQNVYVFVERMSAPDTIPGGQPAGTGNRTLGPGGEGEGQAPTLPSTDFDEVARQVPTFRYHTFWRTSMQIRTAPGHLVTIYDPQTSFGSFIAHEGPLYGWQHDLVPATVDRLGVPPAGRIHRHGPDQFTFEVPDGGAVLVQSVVTPLEHPPRPKPIPWWLRFWRWLVRLWHKLFG
jgi:hypothetical protein